MYLARVKYTMDQSPIPLSWDIFVNSQYVGNFTSGLFRLYRHESTVSIALMRFLDLIYASTTDPKHPTFSPFSYDWKKESGDSQPERLIPTFEQFRAY